VKHSVKNGRKIFKLLNFLLEFKRLQFVLEKRKPLLYKTALALCRVFNFFYYFFDNILWASKIGKFRYKNQYNKQIATSVVYLQPE